MGKAYTMEEYNRAMQLWEYVQELFSGLTLDVSTVDIDKGHEGKGKQFEFDGEKIVDRWRFQLAAIEHLQELLETGKSVIIEPFRSPLDSSDPLKISVTVCSDLSHNFSDDQKSSLSENLSESILNIKIDDDEH